MEAGKALTQLRDRKLYRSTHKTFEEYCRDRFGFTRMAAALKIASVKVMENLSTNGCQNPTGWCLHRLKRLGSIFASN